MDTTINRRSLVLAASTASSVALVPRWIGAQATPVASPVAMASMPEDVMASIREAVITTMETESIPGAVVHLSVPGYTPFVEPFGIADKETETPITLETHFRIGSITKTFVGTVILQLVDEGGLSLEDTIDTWNIDVPNADRMTIRHLLNMTSGLQNFTETIAFADAMNADPTQALLPDETIAMVADTALSEPGEGYYYNNTNFVILGVIIEAIVGEPLEAVLQMRIFGPMGMTQTGLGLDASMPEPFARGYGDVDPEIPDEIAAQLATPVATPEAMLATPEMYTADVDGHYDTTEFNPVWAWAAGSAWSTVGDLAIWLPAFVRGDMLSPELAAERLDWVWADESMPEYGGYGLGIANFGGLIGHNGAIPGYSCLAVAEPGTGLELIVLTNLYPGSKLLMTPDTQIVNAAFTAAIPLMAL